jgi:hypothetical protein
MSQVCHGRLDSVEHTALAAVISFRDKILLKWFILPLVEVALSLILVISLGRINVGLELGLVIVSKMTKANFIKKSSRGHVSRHRKSFEEISR